MDEPLIDVVAEIEKATEPPCPTCGSLAHWRPAHGPDAVRTRILGLVAAVDAGLFDEVPPVVSGHEHARWSSIDAPRVTSVVVMNGYDPDLDVAPSITVRCRSCRRTYTQQWSPDHGAERWTMVVD
jgi:hypothetical protein